MSLSFCSNNLRTGWSVRAVHLLSNICVLPLRLRASHNQIFTKSGSLTEWIQQFKLNHSMLRVRIEEITRFLSEYFGASLIETFVFDHMGFTLYFLGLRPV